MFHSALNDHLTEFQCFKRGASTDKGLSTSVAITSANTPNFLPLLIRSESVNVLFLRSGLPEIRDFVPHRAASAFEPTRNFSNSRKTAGCFLAHSESLSAHEHIGTGNGPGVAFRPIPCELYRSNAALNNSQTPSPVGQQFSPPSAGVAPQITLTAEQFQLLLQNRTHKKRPARRLPVFNGDLIEDPNYFLQAWVSIFRDCEMDPNEWVYVAQDQLKNTAASYWAPFKRLQHTWEQFSSRLQKKFDGPDSRAKLSVELYSDKQKENETVEIFVA